MKLLVVYVSMFGNTRQIAEAIAAGASSTAEVAGCAPGALYSTEWFYTK